MGHGPLNVALVGYGYAAKTFHAPLIGSVAGLRLRTVVSSDPAKVAVDLPDADVVGDVQAAFADPAIDLVVIATPNQLHAVHAHAAISAGKHVVIDKPFALDSAEAARIMAHAEEKRAFLSVFHNRRWDSDFLTLRRLMAEGALGEVMHFESHFDRHRPEVRNRWRERAGAGSGAWFDLGPHLVDQAIQLFGPPGAVYADIAAQRAGAETDDYFHVVLRYPENRPGLRVVLHGGMIGPGARLRLCVHGTEGSYVKHGLDAQESALRAGIRPCGPGWGEDPEPGTVTASTPAGDPAATPVAGDPGCYQRYYAAVRDAIRDGAPNPVPAGEALATMRVIERAFDSALSRREERLTC